MKSKRTGLANSYLSKDRYFIHFFILIAFFGVNKRDTIYKSESRLSDKKYRKIVFDNNEMYVSKNFLGMDFDFLVFIYLLKQFESKNYKKNINTDKFDCDISLDCKLFCKEFGIKFNKKAKENIINSLDNLIDLKVKFKDEVLDWDTTTTLINSFKNKDDLDFISVEMSKSINSILYNKRQIFFKIDELLKFESSVDKKLFLLLKSYNKNKNGFVKTKFLYEDLAQILGQKVEYYIDDDLVETVAFKDSRRTIKRSLERLADHNEIESVDFKNKQVHYIIKQKRHTKSIKNNETEKSLDFEEISDEYFD